MEYFTNNDALITLLTQYGSILLFFLLILGIIALPIPEETLMVLSGVLMCNGHLNIPLTMLAAYAGSICGITLSYTLGRTAGAYLLHKYQSWLGITEKQLALISRYGKWALFIGYFIPGVRHLTGFSFGMADTNFKQFALYAYSGAVLWVSLFLGLGYFFGEYPLAILENMEITMDEIIIVLICLFAAYGLFFVSKRLWGKRTQRCLSEE